MKSRWGDAEATRWSRMKQDTAWHDAPRYPRVSRTATHGKTKNANTQPRTTRVDGGFEFFVLGALPTWALQAPASNHQSPSLAQFETLPICFSLSVCLCVYGSLRAAISSHPSLQNSSGLQSSTTKKTQHLSRSLSWTNDAREVFVKLASMQRTPDNGLRKSGK